MTEILLACMLVPQIDRPGTNSDLIRNDFDRLAADSDDKRKQASEFRTEALRTARLARLDQLLALTGTQRQTLARRLREDVSKPFVGSVFQVGPLLKSDRLKSVLTTRQWQVFLRWREQGSLAWYARKATDGGPRIESDCRDAAILVVDRMVTELGCTERQRQRLEIAARGLAPRFRRQFAARYAQLGKLHPPLTTEVLLQDGTLVPLLDEVEFWRRAVASTLTTEQNQQNKKQQAERLAFYRHANAICTTADLQLGLPMNFDETRQFSRLMQDRFALQRAVFPLKEPSHPVLQLKKTDLESFLRPERLTEFLEFARQARESLTNRRPADPVP